MSDDARLMLNLSDDIESVRSSKITAGLKIIEDSSD